MDNWAKQILKDNQSSGFPIDELGILKGYVNGDTVSKQFHQEMPKGAVLRELSENVLHQINWETPYYNQVLVNFLKDAEYDKPILDLGCGDGRFTRILLDMGFEKIVCVDSDYRLLESLQKFSFQSNFRDKLLIVHSDADELPFKNKNFSVVLAIGVLYYLNEKKLQTLQKIHSLLIDNGIFVQSEPDMEGMIFRSLIFGSIEDTIEVFDQNFFKEGHRDTTFKFMIREQGEEEKILSHSGFTVEDKHGITMFHNFLRIMLVRGAITNRDIEVNIEGLKKIFDFLHERGSLHKHIIWKCRKKI